MAFLMNGRTRDGSLTWQYRCPSNLVLPHDTGTTFEPRHIDSRVNSGHFPAALTAEPG